LHSFKLKNGSQSEPTSNPVRFFDYRFVSDAVEDTIFPTDQKSFANYQHYQLSLTAMCRVVTFVVILINRSPGTSACQTVSTSLPP
jgi:hypothetical protein